MSATQLFDSTSPVLRKIISALCLTLEVVPGEMQLLKQRFWHWSVPSGMAAVVNFGSITGSDGPSRGALKRLRFSQLALGDLNGDGRSNNAYVQSFLNLLKSSGGSVSPGRSRHRSHSRSWEWRDCSRVGDQPGLSSGDQLTSSLQLRAGLP